MKLPTYAFIRETYWAKSLEYGKKAGINYIYQIEWENLPTQHSPLGPADQWLILVNDDDVSNDLISVLTSNNVKLNVVNTIDELKSEIETFNIAGLINI